jgi:cholera toxin transcriptional activator
VAPMVVVMMLVVLMLVITCRLRSNGGVHADIVAFSVGSRWSSVVSKRFIERDQRLSTKDCLAVHYGRAVMQMTPSNRELLRFGVFEVDLAAGVLRKNGARIRLQEQPFQVLTALLQNAGQVVTRDDLREKIWPADTFVDFDHSLNTAVNKIRESLGDSASSPRFVETLARRGYRFIAPVDNIAAAASATAHAHENVRHDNDPATTPAAEIVLHPELDVPAPRRGLVRALFALIQAMYLIFYVGGLAHLRDADRVASSFLPGWRALVIVGAVLVTGAAGIPLRFYLLSAVAFDYRKLAAKFARLFPFVLLLDGLWAIAPFLLLPQIGIGLAFAATAALLYVPFSERTLVRLSYPT